jgi:lipid-A-disaccharide synthase-like uncharacterized protein
MEIISWLGNLFLALCGLPLAIEAIRKKTSVVPTLFYFTWLIGEMLVFVYTVYLSEWSLVFNYSCNIMFLAIVGYYKFKRN